jgi:DNA-binding transcriptional LysR family regulator
MVAQMPIDIPQLEAFLAVSKRGGFSGAATELHLTQPAVSKRIAALESALDTRLFDRIGKQVSLTEAGVALSTSAEKILAELADSQRVLSNLRSGVGGQLTIASSHHIGLHRLPPVLRAYASRYPGVALDLKFMDSEIACNRVAHGELELALITLPQQLSAPRSRKSTCARSPTIPRFCPMKIPLRIDRWRICLHVWATPCGWD